MNELRYNIDKQFFTEPMRFEWYYRIARNIGGLADDFDPIDSISIKNYEGLKSYYTKYIDSLYSKVPANETKYRDRVYQELATLDFNKNKHQIPSTIYFTTTLALLDIQNQLYANTIYIDSTNFYQQAIVTNGKIKYQILPVLTSKYQHARYIVNGDTIYCSPDSLLIAADSFADSLTFEFSLVTKEGDLFKTNGKIRNDKR
jgi:hypothetical protein